VEERILHYFLAMGAQQAPNTDSNPTGLSFLVGADQVHVMVLKTQDLAQRNSIIDTVLKLSSLRNSYQTVYLAAPRLLGATIDASIFRAYGIGLLFFDERRIDEVVAPQPLQATRPQPIPSPAQDQGLVSELASLKSMYFEMERNLTQLRDDLKNLHETPRNNGFEPQLSQPLQVVSREPVYASTITQGGPLPSYFSNNPWLEVLSKRGRSEN